ncbi:hypothetical protein [Microbacterium terricola]|uniref:PepSY domain-containing protein n=1 Tax=Microbacterium terricola TaxID=344163 RepID=A0ABM8DWD0_9MICO|nr:hypothetical protein [Microbacterium terricola]UYK39466.1 hypothetical protein OAU46_12260 [Microbacterium terricola]BDV29806.1 hypothetical protein Microterr_04660 [Microbacterium terricola]
MNSDENPTTPRPDESDAVTPAADQDAFQTAPMPASQPTADAPAAAPVATEPARRGGTMRPLLIGAAAGIGVLLIGGIGIGAVSALSSGQFQNVPATAVTNVETPAPSPTAAPDDADADADSGSGSGAATDAAATAEQFTAAIDRAVAAAEGTGASSVEVESNGWSVDVVLSDGSEIDVRVGSDGTETVRADHRDSDADPAIDTARIGDIVVAAVTAAGGGTVTAIETEGDGSHAYDVTVRLDDGAEADVALADDLSVVDVDIDND